MHGDRVVVRIERYREDGRAEGSIVQVLERARARRSSAATTSIASGLGFVAPFDKRLTADIQIPRGETRDAEPGEMVTVEVTRWPTPTRGPAGRIVEVLGDINDPGVDTEIILRKHDIPDEHSAEAIAEAQAHRRRRQGEGHRRPHRLPRSHRRHHRRRARARLRRCDFDREAEERPLLAGRAHRRRRALRAGGRRARSGSLRARHVGVFPRARRAHVPVGAGDRAVQPATRTSIGWCSRA